MAIEITQAGRWLSIETPVAENLLLVNSFSLSEGVSQLFSIHLELIAEIENAEEISKKTFIGEEMKLSMQLANGENRFVHGIVSRFIQAERDARFQYYKAEVVPWLWLLSLTSDCRIFQDMSAPDIIAKIFADHGLSDFRDALTKDYTKRDYCVQYRETDLNFISRLMEDEGIFYFFEHVDDKHVLVLTDSTTDLTDCPGQASASYLPEAGTGEGEDTISAWYTTQALRPGKFTLRDFHFEMPSKSLEVNELTMFKDIAHSDFEVYDYPGQYAEKFKKPGERLGDVEPEGKKIVRVRMEEEETPHFVFNGSSFCRPFSAGFRFKLVNHSAKMDGAYVLTSVQHSGVQHPSYVSGSESGLMYYNSFTCSRTDMSLRPARVAPKPIVQGPQTAIVVGPAGEEIHTDKFGRVKVQFHWDREGKRDENSSCWIRVSHPWAGKGWGAVSIPRIGQEVIVDFLEGDPDRPIITGRVYNAETMPPYGLPAGGVVSGIKSNTHKGKGYNEISMDDTAGKEKITIHAQYDMGTTVEHDDSQTVHNNRTITVDGTHTETIKKETKITITEGPFSHDVVANTATYHAKGAVKENYDATQTTTVKNEILIDSTAASVHIEAATEIQLHTGDSLLLMKKDGTITISGKKILITGSDEVKMGVGNQNVICDKQKVATSGAAINSSAVGMHEITGGLVKIN